VTAVVLSTDLMDRSRFPAGTRFARRGEDLDADADVVVVDLARADALDAVRRLRVGGAAGRIVGYGSHVERGLLDAAREAGCDEVLTRRAFFADVGAHLSG
jgi:hypothetical protein